MIRKPRTFPPATDSGPFAAFGSRSGGGCRSLGDCRMAGGGCDSGSGGMLAAAGAGPAESFRTFAGGVLADGGASVPPEVLRSVRRGSETDGPGAGLRAVLAERYSAREPAGFSGAASGRSGLGEAGQTDAAGAVGRLRMPGRPQHVSGEQGGPPCRLLRIRERPDGRERGTSGK